MHRRFSASLCRKRPFTFRLVVDAVRQKFFARLVLLAFAAFCAVWLLTLDHRQKISTNVLDLMPAAEQSPELGIVRGFANNVQARVMLFAIRDHAAPDAPPTAAAQTFARALITSPAIAEAMVMGDTTADDALGRELFERRFEWLLPTWLGQREREFARTGQTAEAFSAWLAGRVAADLEAFLNQPEATALQALLPRDPLLLVPTLVNRTRLLRAGGSAAQGHALVWARITDSPFAEAGQGPVFTAIDQAMDSLRTDGSGKGFDVQWTGVNRFAAASRARIQAEIAWLNLFSVAAVLGISCVFVRHIYKLLHLVPVILLSIAGAWTISTMLFDRLHILVFVIGSLLSGVAIDYGFYIYMQLPRRSDEPYAERLRRILKPLLVSCLTTAIGFSLLLFSELPLIRQIGAFVCVGLLCALGAAILYFAQLPQSWLESRQCGALDLREAPPRARSIVRAGLGLMAVVAVAGLLRVSWHDDVRELDQPATELQANDAALRSLFGASPGQAVYLTHGSTLAEARQRLDAYLDHQYQTTPEASTASAGLLLPTEADWRALPVRLDSLRSFAAELNAALEQRGFTAESFAPFFVAWNELRASPPARDYTALAASVRGALTGPLALLSNTVEAPFWFLTIVDPAPTTPPPSDLNTVGLSQLQSLNDLFTRYRWSALRLSLVGLGLLIVSVFVIYPPRLALRIALIPAGSCLFVFGVLGLLGQPLNLFHLLGAFLGVCLSHDYAIFSSENAVAGLAPPVPVRLSACSTAASFGVLATSGIPVIHAMGVTVSLIVLAALAFVEVEALVRRRPA